MMFVDMLCIIIDIRHVYSDWEMAVLWFQAAIELFSSPVVICVFFIMGLTNAVKSPGIGNVWKNTFIVWKLFIFIQFYMYKKLALTLHFLYLLKVGVGNNYE
jgi:hypothetical protein